MSDQEILTKAIQKAIDGGWNEPLIAELGVENYAWSYFHSDRSINNTIFDHDFAKALWGEKRIKGAMLASPNQSHYITNPLAAVREYKLNEDYGWHRAWELHLQQMVVADDPIKYLGENI